MRLTKSSWPFERRSSPGHHIARWRRWACCLIVAMAALPSSATTLAGKEDYEVCQACHGVSGQGTPALDAPRIAGLDAAYVIRQLTDFREGRRGTQPEDTSGQQMTAMAKVLADAASVERVAGYIAALPNAPAASTVNGDI